MTRDELQAAGRVLFGARWQSSLARALGMSGRHMRRLVDGSAEVHDGIACDVERLLAQRRSDQAMQEIDALIAQQGAPVEIALTEGRDAAGRAATKLLAKALRARGILVTVARVDDIAHPAERAAEAAIRRKR